MSDDALHAATSDALRKLGRDDLADQLESPTPDPTPPAPAEDPNEVFLQQLKDAQNKGSVSLLGLLDQ
jgi:hypothetical protein